MARIDQSDTGSGPIIPLPRIESVDIIDQCGVNSAAAGDSSSGKTTDSGSVNRGSNPRSPANFFVLERGAFV